MHDAMQRRNSHRDLCKAAQPALASRHFAADVTMTTLISFLGKQQQWYRTARYRMDAQTLQTVPFFGMALANYLQPDRLILLGTSSSMWDVFFERESGELDEDLLTIHDAALNNAVTTDMLHSHAHRLAQRQGYAVDCLLIPYARDTVEQTAILAHLAEVVEEGERIVLDVTHAFRHLPMLALVAARYLRRVRQVDVVDIYYGALEMTPPDGETPVLRLGGMLHMLDWVDALASYDKDGDPAPFASLMNEIAPEAASLLQQAAYFERCNAISEARRPLRDLRQHLEQMQTADGDPLLRLFLPALQTRTDWVNNKYLDDRQQDLAWHFLEHRDYLRASILGFEALITQLVRQEPANLDPRNHEHRKRVKRHWEKQTRHSKGQLDEMQQAYLDLRELRNCLAHGSRSEFAHIQRVLANEAELQEILKSAIRLAHAGARTTHPDMH